MLLLYDNKTREYNFEQNKLNKVKILMKIYG